MMVGRRLVFALIVSSIATAGCATNQAVRVSKETIVLRQPDQDPKSARKLTFASDLSCSADEIWEEFQKPQFLGTLFFPKAILREEAPLPARWREGQVDAFAFTMSSWIPFGTHFINWELIDAKHRIIQTREHGFLVPMWDNLIQITATGEQTSRFYDELVIRAGIFSAFTARYAEDLFRYRHANLVKVCLDADAQRGKDELDGIF